MERGAKGVGAWEAWEHGRRHAWGARLVARLGHGCVVSLLPTARHVVNFWAVYYTTYIPLLYVYVHT